MTDGKIDGQFKITQGQGITQGIATELGLTNNECKKISGSIWQEIINEFDNQENININNKNSNKSNNYLVHTNDIIKISKNCWQKIVSLINNALNKNIQIDDTDENTNISSSSKTDNTKPPTEIQLERMKKHEEVVKRAVELIERNWNISGLGEHFKTEEDKQLFLNCLKEVKYDPKSSGAGHSDEEGFIHIETDNEKCNSLAEMTKLLIHEANHAFLSRKSKDAGTLTYPTKAEEIECETLALQATGKMVKANVVDKDGNKLDDYEIYNNPISYYAENNPQDVQGFNDWLGGYNKLADNLNGDITIKHHSDADLETPAGTIELGDDDGVIINGKNYQIKERKLVESTATGRKEVITSDSTVKYRGRLYNISVSDVSLSEYENNSLSIKGGDTLQIEGYPPITIGKNAMLEGCENTCVMQLIIHHKDHSTPTILSNMIFDDLQPTDKEKELSGQNLDGEKVKFTVTKQDGTKIEGYCYNLSKESFDEIR